MPLETKDNLRSRATYDNFIIIAAGNSFPESTREHSGFAILPLTEGRVVATSKGRQEIDHTLPVFVPPGMFIKLSSSTAVDVMVMW